MCAEAIKRKEDVKAVGIWLRENTASKYYMAYVLGTYAGLRFSELEPLVKARSGSSINMESYREILEAAVEQCGVRCNVGIHTPRKTFGFHHFLKHRNLSLLQTVFGHSKPEFTARYVGL